MTAFVFAGQGDQRAGMGREFYERSAAARAVFDACDAIRPGTVETCFYGGEEQLKQTATTQPCLFAMELAAAAALDEAGVRPDVVAGFSLGEVAAATFAGLFGLEDGFRLVCKRGELMQAAAEKVDAAMAAVVKLTDDKVRDICSEFEGRVFPVNFNCPCQVTVSGLREAMTDFSQAVRDAGGRALPLKVAGGFHSPFMKEAAQAFGTELAKVEFRPTRMPLYSNLTGSPYTLSDAAGLLSAQIAGPVLWEKSVRSMIAAGITRFVEIGPGRTLTGMIKKIGTDVEAVTVFEVLDGIGK